MTAALLERQQVAIAATLRLGRFQRALAALDAGDGPIVGRLEAEAWLARRAEDLALDGLVGALRERPAPARPARVS